MEYTAVRLASLCFIGGPVILISLLTCTISKFFFLFQVTAFFSRRNNQRYTAVHVYYCHLVPMSLFMSLTKLIVITIVMFSDATQQKDILIWATASIRIYK